MSVALTVSAQPKLPCGVDDSHLPDSTIRLMSRLPELMRQQQARRAGERNICRLAIEIDSDTYLAFDKDTNQIKRIFSEKIERVSRIYEREINTQLVITYFHFWKDTEPDPYRGEGNLYKLYTIMSQVWTAKPFSGIAYDKRVYMILKSSNGAGGLGSGQQAIVANQADDYTIAHELGHCFDSPHTHSCSWPGGPIDFCSAVEGDCYKGSVQRINGTIMSYCSTTPSFHPLCQALMTRHAVANFQKVTAAPPAPVLPASLTLAGMPFLWWPASPSADLYQLDVATDAGFSQKIVSDTTSLGGYLVSNLLPGTPYYIRMKASNAFGTSAWSAVSLVQMPAPTALPAPVLLLPAADQRSMLYNDGNRQFVVQPVSGATAYDVQTADGNDVFFSYPDQAQRRSQTSFTLTSYRTGVVRWRARAVVNGQAGPWSEARRYVVGRSYSPVTFPFNISQAPSTLPYAYYAVTGRQSRIVATLSTDTLLMTPLQVQTFEGEYSYTGLLRNLAPNTTYYLTTDEYNVGMADQPAGLLLRTRQTIRTGSPSSSSDRWSFVNSITHAAWPQGEAYYQAVAGQNAIWCGNSKGLVRIDPDSLTIRTYDQSSTRGGLGNLTLAYSVDDEGKLWASSRVSVNTFKNGFSVPYSQLGRLVETTGTLEERLSFATPANGINAISGTPRLVFEANGIREIKGDSLAWVYRLPTGQNISQRLVKNGEVWLLSYSSSVNGWELTRYNKLTRTAQTYNYTNTPQLGKSIQQMAMDGLGNLWVLQLYTTGSAAPIARFNGQSWTQPAVPFQYVMAMSSDPLGNLYVIDNTTARSVYRYNGVTWNRLGDMPSLGFVSNFTVDRDGNLWLSGAYQLMRYTTCANVTKAVLTADNQQLETSDAATLRAIGCTDVLWSWSSDAETVSNRLVRGTNQLLVKPTMTTTYRARCYSGTCPTEEASVTVTVSPRLYLTKTNRTTYCPGDTLATGYSLLGRNLAGDQLTLVLKSGTRQVTLPATTDRGAAVAYLPATLEAGRYTVYLQLSPSGLRTRDSLDITLSVPPTAELSSNKATFTLGDSARVSVALTGLAPWQFTRWDNQRIQTTVTPYVGTVRATQPTSYSLTIRNLADANCAAGIVRNELVVSALALGVEPAALGMRVFPNPVEHWLTIDVEATSAPLANLHLMDVQGRTVLRRPVVGVSRHEQLDLRSLPGGTYLLQVELRGGAQAQWKVVKL